MVRMGSIVKLGWVNACKPSLNHFYLSSRQKSCFRYLKKAVIDFPATHAYAGDLIPHTGGVRKVRVPASGRDNRGGISCLWL